MSNLTKFIIRWIYYIIFIILVGIITSIDYIFLFKIEWNYLILHYLMLGSILSFTCKIPLFSRRDFFTIKNIRYTKADKGITYL